MQTITINGRFLGQPLSGVQRFARELTLALDRKIAAGTVPDALKGASWRLAVPGDAPADIDLKAITVDSFGSGPGHLWEQTALYRRSRGGRLIGFGGSGPLFGRRQLVVIHDVTIFRHPQSFRRSYRLLHGALGFALTRTAKIGTVSEFSRRELASVFRVPASGIDVIYNAVDHFATIVPDESIIGRLGLETGGFFLLVGTMKPNKNLDFAIRAFEALGQTGQKLVVVGGTAPTVFRAKGTASTGKIIYAGRLTDAEIAALERHATAFIFPSLYEGFGIPPLEAMTQACPVLAADIPSIREASGKAALYFDPVKEHELVSAMKRITADQDLRDELRAEGRRNVARFSWDASADRVLTLLEKL
ncbi:glycosyltransferase family 1 protein [Rhizobium sp. BK376]|uniref:glycosyltransferase family 4 protein n=1 Tax=Rhizobium sp. BK376 TaxID=2512149 RepID=UPI0010452218|nr:glycosyltransferase family 1 protein [Rhizobium sp. BK376]TCR83520.1 glycosyltransferase involved in cell wall biosynthesis [Rhizobium sp. BK376]